MTINIVFAHKKKINVFDDFYVSLIQPAMLLTENLVIVSLS